jgi:hypothetical protein
MNFSQFCPWLRPYVGRGRHSEGHEELRRRRPVQRRQNSATRVQIRQRCQAPRRAPCAVAGTTGSGPVGAAQTAVKKWTFSGATTGWGLRGGA